MKPITTLYIPFVENGIDAYFIQQVFYYNNIATISNVTFIPSFHNDNSKQAILEVYYWHNTSYAFDIISRLYNYHYDTHIYYANNKSFIIQIYSFQNYALQKFTITQQQVITLQKLLIKQQYKNYFTDYDDWREIEIALYNNNIYHNLLLHLIY